MSWSSETSDERAAGQQPGDLAGVGRQRVARVIVDAGPATASAAARPDTVAQPTAAPSAPGSAPNRRVPSSSAMRATVGRGSPRPTLGGPLLRPQ